ncbi:MAG: hypothetical protein R3C04_05585 [Hyphomonas sp.]
MPVGWSLIVAATICAFLLSGRHLSLFLWPFLTQSTLSMAFAVLLPELRDMAVRRQGTPAIVPYLLLACLCALAASASQITGLIVWLLLLFQIVRFFRTPAPGPMAFVFLLGSAVYAAYFIGFSSGPVPGASLVHGAGAAGFCDRIPDVLRRKPCSIVGHGGRGAGRIDEPAGACPSERPSRWGGGT